MINITSLKNLYVSGNQLDSRAKPVLKQLNSSLNSFFAIILLDRNLDVSKDQIIESEVFSALIEMDKSDILEKSSKILNI